MLGLYITSRGNNQNDFDVFCLFHISPPLFGHKVPAKPIIITYAIENVLGQEMFMNIRFERVWFFVVDTIEFTDDFYHVDQ